MQAVQGRLQARLYLTHTSQLAHCLEARDTLGVAAVPCSSTLVFTPSQFLTGSRVNGSREPCSSGWHPACSNGGMKVVCMARERRVKMVSQQVKREISQMLLYDKVLQAAVLPETALGADMYLTAVATISDVEMSKDLSVAKVYISIYGDDRGQEKALQGLKNKAGYVRKGLAQRMNLKNTPEVRFIKDEALERGSRVIAILDKLKKERELKEGKGQTDRDEDENTNEEDNDEYEDVDMSSSASVTTSYSRHEGDDSDWEDAENITFIK